MRSEPSEHSPNESVNTQPQSDPTSTQYGSNSDHEPSTPLLLRQGEHGSHRGSSSSEWSLSPAAGLESPSSTDAWLESYERLAFKNDDIYDEPESHALGQGLPAEIAPQPVGRAGKSPTGSHLLTFPEELLFHVLSHLPATDLLKVKLVSRRFCALVNSPHAWMNAFARYFPSTEALKSTADTSMLRQEETSSQSDRRSFSRLTHNASWRTEYLIRTRLLRCLSRGRPSLPFASPCPGKPGRGSATFTYSSRLRMGCSSLHADFGNLFDKRKPQFIHGLDATGSVTSSDRKGKFDSWGFIDRVAFRHFSEVYPGYSQWGLGPTDIIGLPNVMDVSQPYGMVYGEGTPGGFVFHLASDERHGRYLAPFLNVGYPELGVPKIHQDLQCVCSVWMAKSSSIPRVSKGAVGILAGSSSGVVSAFSFGSPTTRDNRFDRGQLTARWLLSPGVPIVSIVADDNITDERRDQGRVWAVALNALGEIFYLKCFPSEASESIQLGSKEVVEEVTAWQYGQSVDWNLIWPTLRSNRYPTRDRHDSTGPLPSAVTGDSEPRNITDETRMMEAWLHKSPVEIKADFKAWDMRRSLKVDFGGDDGHHSGEGIVIIEPGLEEGGSAKVRRFVRRLNKTSKDEFGLSRLVFGPYKGIQATASAVDLSNFANTTATEDKWHRSQNGDPSSFDSSVLNLPGQRGRLLGVGTTAGTVFLWNMRTPCPESSSLVSQIRPVRVIHTDSPGIASLAISSLYVVHGGEEGLVQAWDPLASTLLPLRTLSSRHAINNRRRAVIAAQQNPNQQRNPAFVQSLAASAICLDPNPTNLRGVVAIGGFLKYWSYSSVSAAEEGSKSQKRRLNKATRTSGGSSGGDFSGTRRIGLKSYVEQEILQREIDERERRQESKEERRMAGRFGLDLLGHDASEEEMVAYAKLLSEEQKQKETRNGSEDLGQSTVAGPSLSDEGLKQWQYASWPQRLEMAGASSSAAHSRGSQTPTPKSVNVRDGDDAEVARAMELSIQEEARRSTSSRSESTADTSTYDEELAEAVARSLAPDATGADARASSSANTISAAARIGGGEQEDADDEVARAIKLSLQDTSSSPQVSSSTSERIPDGTDFPSLSSSSPEGTSRGKGKGKGKGKRRA